MPRSSWLTSTMFSVPPWGQAMWWLWTTSARTKWLAFENESRLPEPSCSICRPTRLTSTPSKKHGPSSSICSARPKPEPPRRSNKPSHNCFHRSGHKTRKHGSELRSTLYSKEEYALGDKVGPLDRRNQAFTMWNTNQYGFQESTDPLYKDIPFFLTFR